MIRWYSVLVQCRELYNQPDIIALLWTSLLISPCDRYAQTAIPAEIVPAVHRHLQVMTALCSGRFKKYDEGLWCFL